MKSGDVLALQRTIGNQATIQLLAQTRARPPSSPSAIAAPITPPVSSPNIIQRTGSGGKKKRKDDSQHPNPNATIVASGWDRNVSLREATLSNKSQPPQFVPNPKKKIGSKISSGTRILATAMLDPEKKWRLALHPTTNALGFVRLEKVKLDEGLKGFAGNFSGVPDEAPATEESGTYQKWAGRAGSGIQGIADANKHVTAPVTGAFSPLLDLRYQKERKDKEGAIASDQWGVTRPAGPNDDGKLEAELTDFGKGVTGATTGIGVTNAGLGALSGIVSFAKEVQVIHKARKEGDWETFTKQMFSTVLDTGAAGASDLLGGIASGVAGFGKAAGSSGVVTHASQVAAVFGSIAHGLRGIVSLSKLITDSISVHKKRKRGEAGKGDVATLGSDVLQLIKSQLAMHASIINTLRLFLGAFEATKAAVSLFGPIASFITIAVSLISILIESIDLARRAYHLVMSNLAARKIKKDEEYQQLLVDLPSLAQAIDVPQLASDPSQYHLLDDEISQRRAELSGEMEERDRLSSKRRHKGKLKPKEQDRLKQLSRLKNIANVSADDRESEIDTLHEREGEVAEKDELRERRKAYRAQRLEAIKRQRLGQRAGSGVGQATQQANVAQQLADPQTLPNAGNVASDASDGGQSQAVTFTAEDRSRLKAVKHARFGTRDKRRLQALEEYQALEKLREFLTMQELITVNNKRFNRQLTPVVVKFGNISADILSIVGAITSAIITVTGAAAYGAGAAAGMGVSIITGVTSASIKLGGAGTIAGAKGWRTLKQAGRNREWKGFNKEKSSELKKERRFRHTATLLKMAGSLPAYDNSDSEVKGQYKRMETFLEVAGVDLGDFYKHNGNIGQQVKMLMEALAQRNANLG
ncbi:MAG: hypothetical protein WDZ49_10480 [Litorilinea sp.]